MAGLKELIGAGRLIEAPAVFNPLMAKLAEAAGFPALYLGGGALGYVQCWTEANLTLTEMVRIGLDIRAASALPLILDGAAGWGDPMHLHRTVALAEAAGFAAIEIEDQILPKRAHHHVGTEHMVEAELMAAKVREAVAARRDPSFLIIARTNAPRSTGAEDGARRLSLYREAGADMLLVTAERAEDVRFVAERLGPPLVLLRSDQDLRRMGLAKADLAGLGVRLLVDPSTPTAAFHRALRECYAAMANGDTSGLFGPEGSRGEERAIHRTIGLDALLAIEKATVET